MPTKANRTISISVIILGIHLVTDQRITAPTPGASGVGHTNRHAFPGTQQLGGLHRPDVRA